MSNCCDNKEEALQKTIAEQKHVLWIVLWINVVMFGAELAFGILSGSLSLIGDSLDMLGDAVTYASSLAVVAMGVAQKARVAKLKASIMLGFGIVIAGKCMYRYLNPQMPTISIMLSIGLLALVMNLLCLYLLTRHRHDDVNMRSVWVCSRNDIVANVSVLVAAVLVFTFESGLPDLLVGVGLTILFVKSSLGVFRDANKSLVAAS